MKLSRKTVWLIVALLTVSFLLAGCNPIPEEYTNGVKLHKSYPEDDLPIMDNAVVYYCEAEDDAVSVKYGVEDELDDVADFYKDFFDDNGIILDDESDKSSRYTAEGRYMGFVFSIKASAASGEYEEKVFKTVVKIDIDFVSDSLGSIDNLIIETTSPYSLSEDILGFWRQESFEDTAGKTSTYDYGLAYEFLANGTLNLYYDFELIGAGTWAYVDNTTILLTAIDGTQENVTANLERRSGKDYLIWVDSTGTLTFFRDISDEFIMDGTTGSTDTSLGDDSELASSIADKVWYYVYYIESNGNMQNSSTGYLTYFSDGTLEDTFDDEFNTGSWYTSQGWLHCDYADGTSVGWDIEVLNINGTNYLFYYSSNNPGAYWLYADIPRESIPGWSSDITLYLTDAEKTSALINQELHDLYYLYSDGTTEAINENTILFYDNGTFDDYYQSELQTGTWQFNNGYLELYYDDGESYYYPSYVEYDNASDAYYLFLGDLEEGYEGCYWVFTTYQP